MRAVVWIVGVLLVLLGGYALSAVVSAVLALGLSGGGMARSEAVVLAGMLAFLVYLGSLLWAPSRRRLALAGLSFRQTMGLVHTRAGVVLGGVMFAIFWMGTLAVFDREIDRWMMPETRLGPPPPRVSLDATAHKAVATLAPDATQWSVTMPTSRTPTLQLRYQQGGEKSVSRHVEASRSLFRSPGARIG
jgi:hypothetical protein